MISVVSRDAYEHKSLSASMIEASRDKATRLLEQRRRLLLAADEFERVLDELERPARPVEPLVRLARRVGDRRD